MRIPRCPHGFLPPLCPNCHEPRKPKPVAGGGASREPHNAFVDMTGNTLAGAVVLRREPNVDGGARWLIRLACGHEKTVLGTSLRHTERRGWKLACGECGDPRRK